MADDAPPPTARVGDPLYAKLTPVPVGCFVGALITDVVYAVTADMLWADFSVWLVTAGLVVAALAVAAALVHLFVRRRAGGVQPSPIQATAYISALVMELINAFVHSRDAYTSVVPTGLALSALTVAVLAVAAWSRPSLVRGGGSLSMEGAR